MTAAEQIAILRAALEEYADPENWCSQPRPYDKRAISFWQCCGHEWMHRSNGRTIARAALLAAGLAQSEAVAVRSK